MTKFSEIYSRFLRRAKQLTLFKYDIDVREEILFDLLEKAIFMFTPYCDNGLLDFEDDGTFSFTLHLNISEKVILAELMVLEFVERKRDEEENMFNMLGTKDYTLHSPANLLNSLNTLLKEKNNDTYDMLNNYSMGNFKISSLGIGD